MKAQKEHLQIIPKELHTLNLCVSRKNSKEGESFYVYHLDGYKYVKEKGRGVDIRVPLGKIQNGKWIYSQSYLKDKEINQLKSQVDELNKKTPDGIVERKLKEESIVQTIDTINDTIKEVPDPRSKTHIQYELQDILFVVLLCSLASYTSSTSITNYIKQFREELSFINNNFTASDISHDTINRLFRIIDPMYFEEILLKFSLQCADQFIERILNIDGKSIRGSKTATCINGRYFLNSYDASNGLCLGHILVDEKHNEITHSSEFLNKLDVCERDILTGDAMYTHKGFVSNIVKKGSKYCLATKENNKTLYKEIMHLFNTHDEALQCPYNTGLELDHGRIEERTTYTLPAHLLSPQIKNDWEGLSNGCIIKSVTRSISKNSNVEQRNSFEVRYFISSIPYSKDIETTKYISKIIRKHWCIENQLHWVLDTNFDEDRIHATNETYLINRSLCHKVALNILRNVQSKTSESTGKNYSLNSLIQMCSTPIGALEILSIFLGKKIMT